jgi:penicillin amidase
MDQVSLYARRLTAYILNAFINVKITDSNLKLALELLRRWDFNMGPYSQVPSIYSVFYKHLLDNVYKNKMGPDLFNEFVFLENTPYKSIMQLMEHPDSYWFDDPSTPRKENRDETIRRSLANALTELEGKYGKDITEWQWGRMHKITFKHAFSGFSSIVDRVLDIGPFEIGGDGTTIFNGEYPFTEGLEKFSRFKHSEFEDILGPVMRFIYDFSKPDRFYLILTTGESGNFISDHYKDMTQMWLHGGYLTIRTNMKSIESPANSLTTIYKK